MPPDPKGPGTVRAAAIVRPLLAGAIASTSLVPTAGAQMFDTFLMLAGIEGESMNVKQQKAIDIVSYSLGFAATPPQLIRGTARPACEPFELTKHLDKASPKLIEHALTGTPIATGRLTTYVAAQTPVETLRIDMQNITVTATSLVVPPGGPATVETITLKPAIYQVRYTSTDGKAAGQAVTFGWNCTTSTPVPVP